jgi:hypothetical protein
MRRHEPAIHTVKTEVGMTTTGLTATMSKATTTRNANVAANITG